MCCNNALAKLKMKREGCPLVIIQDLGMWGLVQAVIFDA